MSAAYQKMSKAEDFVTFRAQCELVSWDRWSDFKTEELCGSSELRGCFNRV